MEEPGAVLKLQRVGAEMGRPSCQGIWDITRGKFSVPPCWLSTGLSAYHQRVFRILRLGLCLLTTYPLGIAYINPPTKPTAV